MTPANIQVPTRALTLWPEWAWAIHHLDKRVENRGWKIPKGEWFAVHAGKCIGGRAGMEAACDADVAIRHMARDADWHVSTTMGDLAVSRVIFRKMGWHSVNWNALETPTSTILGLFRVTDHLPPEAHAPWKAPGQIGNVFEYAPLSAPVPCKGAQGLWRLTPAQRADLALAMGQTS